jgi:hypothetical protein
MNDGVTLFLDESYQDGLLVVGGFIIPNAFIHDLDVDWDWLKIGKFEVPANLEIKSTYGRGDINRKLLDEAGWTQRFRVPAMLEVISQLPITILADVIVDGRVGACPQDWQIDGLRWCIRRFANCGPWTWSPEFGYRRVVHDMPQKPPIANGRKMSPAKKELLSATATTAFNRVYKEMWQVGETFPNRADRGIALSSLGFEQSITFGQASSTNALQVADVICGTVRQYVNYVTNSNPKHEYSEENLSIIAPQFRSKTTGSGLTSVTYGFDCFGQGETEVIKSEFDALFRRSRKN